jgi:hypothetical protein
MFVVEHSASRPLYVRSFVLAVYRLCWKCRRVCGESQREPGEAETSAGGQWWGEHHCQNKYAKSTYRAVLLALSGVVSSKREALLLGRLCFVAELLS